MSSTGPMVSRPAWQTRGVVDHAFSDERLARLYDVLNPWGRSGDDAFYLDLVMSARSVLDVGCGTGSLLHRAREAGHTGLLCGLDPAEAMLDRARVRPDIEWISGDLASAGALVAAPVTASAMPSATPSVGRDRRFDLVVMTGHAFQVLVEDDELRASLAAVRSVLADDGRFVFETRNPPARAWESWTPDHAVEVTTADGAVVRVAHQVETPVDGDVVSFTTTFTSPDWERAEVSRSSLRFLDRDALSSFLSGAGLVAERQYGDWARGPLTGISPEIITVAAPAALAAPAR
ncbi:class I SAM-dependent DNA methyltransferase [Streptomyces scopuliridis]|uniref:class I SAM-dependent DNA methyltransferase n=1 Tax=Streptomyces scopuliridis TaxID=452529 RepID=UPI0036936D74